MTRGGVRGDSVISGGDATGIALTAARHGIARGDATGIALTGGDATGIALTVGDAAGIALTGSDRTGAGGAGSGRAGADANGSERSCAAAIAAASRSRRHRQHVSRSVTLGASHAAQRNIGIAGDGRLTGFRRVRGASSGASCWGRTSVFTEWIVLLRHRPGESAVVRSRQVLRAAPYQQGRSGHADGAARKRAVRLIGGARGPHPEAACRQKHPVRTARPRLTSRAPRVHNCSRDTPCSHSRHMATVPPRPVRGATARHADRRNSSIVTTQCARRVRRVRCAISTDTADFGAEHRTPRGPFAPPPFTPRGPLHAAPPPVRAARAYFTLPAVMPSTMWRLNAT